MNPLTTPPVYGITFGPTEWAVVIVLFFLLFGAKKIPELMRSLGRAQGEYQHAKKEFEKELRSTENAKSTAASASPSTSDTYTPEADLDKAKAKARELDIDPSGKSLDELNKEIAAKTGGPTG